MRGGPGTDYIVIAGLQNGTLVDVFGITEAGDWLLVRAAQVDDGRTGVLGWVAAQLVIPYGDYTTVPLYRADGVSVDAPPEDAVADAGVPTAAPTATPLVTPVISQPEVQPQPASSVPEPEEGEIIVSFAGSQIPPDPLQPITATLADGSSAQLRVQNAEVQVWGGVFNQPEAGWVAADATLLWPGAQAYVQATAASGETTDLDVARIRIIGAPQMDRVKVLALPEIASAVLDNTAMALLGSRDQAGVYPARYGR